MKTTLAKTQNDTEKKWFVVDATGKTLGRLSVQIAAILRGRHKPTYTPHVDTGDFVIVVNADKIAVTGAKETKKSYMFYTGWVGTAYRHNVAYMRANKPEFLIMHAVKGMLPKNRLSSAMLKKLKVYAGAEHPHAAQNPIAL